MHATSRSTLVFSLLPLLFLASSEAACSDSGDTPTPTPTDAGSDGSFDAGDMGADETIADSGRPDLGPDLGTDGADTSPIDTGVIDTGKPDVGSDGDAADAPVDGGTAADCLPTTGATGLDAFFTLMDSSKCVVAQYDAPVGFLGAATWGKHGGPLSFDSATAPTLVRWSVPSAVTGSLTATRIALTVPGVPSGAFWGSQALDLPFFDWTAISYSTSSGGFAGEVILVSTATSTPGALTRYDVDGYFSEGGTSLAATSGRLLYTGLSPLMKTASSTNVGGLYAADTCGTASAPRLTADGDATCKDPIMVSTWSSGSSGPLAIDARGDVFAILSKFGGDQELQGFEASMVARSAAATTGTKLFAIPGFTSEMAADGRAVYFQPIDPTTFASQDVQRVRYAVDAAGKKVTPDAAGVETFLKLKTPGTAVALLTDPSGKLWVSVSQPGAGDAGPTTTRLFVLRDKTP